MAYYRNLLKTSCYRLEEFHYVQNNFLSIGLNIMGS